MFKAYDHNIQCGGQEPKQVYLVRKQLQTKRLRRIIAAGKRLVKVKATCEERLPNMESGCDEKLCNSVFSMDNADFVEANYMVVSEVREYQQVQGLHTDPMVDVDSDDFQEPSMSHGILACPGVGECGISGRVALTAADATHLLQMGRPSGNTMSHHGAVVASHVDAHDQFFMNLLLFGLLMSVYPCHGELQKVLTQSCVSDWDGWTEVQL